MERVKKNKRINRIGILARVITMAVVAIVVGSFVWRGDDGMAASIFEEPIVRDEQEEASDVEKLVMTEEGLQINTQYIRLVYPMEYINDVMVNLSEDNGQSTISVMANFEGMDRELFSLVLSNDECEGYKMGVLKCVDDELGIYTIMNELDTENWPSEEVMRFGRLQESINTLLNQLYETDEFVSF